MYALLRSPLRFSVLAIALGACGGDSSKGKTEDTAVPETTPEIQAEATVATEVEVSACPKDQACDDGDPCTENDRCNAAEVCVGAALDCDDRLACTQDSCSAGQCVHATQAGFCVTDADTAACVATGNADPSNSCRVCSLGTGGAASFTTLPNGATCSDQSKCTTLDTCQEGLCTGGPALVCNAHDPCLADGCDAQTGCTTTPTTAACDDGDPCTTGDVCAAGQCTIGTGALDCDDHDPCTDDSCQAGKGCQHTPHCNDGDPCTNDSCNLGACTNAKFTGPCDDANPCTTGEVCDAGGTCGQGADVECDDANTCTIDTCVADRGGCLHLFVTPDCTTNASGELTCIPATCDDGIDCTIDDQCVAGQCFGGKDQTCDTCIIDGTKLANKIISLEVSSDGNPGSGLDLDNDPMSCAPESLGCGGGVDNALAPLAAIMNPGVEQSIETGAVKWVIDLRNQRTDGQPFDIEVYDSQVLPDDFGNACDYQVDTCEYDPATLSFDPNCEPYFKLTGVTIVGGKITGGGPDQLIRLVLPLKGGATLGMTIANARFEGDVTLDAQGKIKAMNAIVGGAIPKAQLIKAIQDLDPEALPVDKATAVDLINQIIVNDIDLDGDGLEEAASVAMRIRTIPAYIYGN